MEICLNKLIKYQNLELDLTGPKSTCQQATTNFYWFLWSSQEAQRAAKEKAKTQVTAAAPKKEAPVRVPDSLKADVPETQKRVAKKLEKQQVSHSQNYVVLLKKSFI